MKTTSLVSAVALLSSFALAGQARAAITCTPVYGGTGTATAKVYRLFFDAITGNALYGKVDSLTAGNNPVKCKKSGPEVLFAPVGSAALRAYINNDGSSSTVTGLGTPSTTNTVPYTSLSFPAYGYPDLDFIGSDAALGTLATSNLVTPNGDAGPTIELAAFGTPVTLSLTNAVFGLKGLYSKEKLSIAQVCAVFTEGVNINTDAAAALSQPISEVVVRSDGAGATFLITTFLSENCGATPYPFTNAPSTSSTVWGALPGLSAKSGSGGVAAEIAAPIAGGAIGYVGPDYVRPIVKTSGAAPAAVNGVTPSVANIQKHIADYDPTGLSGAQINQDLLGRTYNFRGYPIAGVGFIDLYTNYQDGVGATLQQLLAKLYTDPKTGVLKAVQSKSGLAALGYVGSKFPAVEKAQLNTVKSNVPGGV